MAFWLYLLSDEGGSWPVLKEEPLPSGLLHCEGKILVELFGRYERGDLAWSAFRKLEALAIVVSRPSASAGRS